MTPADVRGWFGSAADGFVALVGQIGMVDLPRTGLGEWDVRALIGHTSRALTTVETYLAVSIAADAGASASLDRGASGLGSGRLASPADYYRAARSGLADPASVTERGRAAGAELGGDPAQVVGALAARVRGLVDASADDALVSTPVGSMRLIDYLPTRAFELTVHGVDLARACGRPLPIGTRAAVRPALALALDLADEKTQEAVLLALTGRASLPPGFSLL